MDSETILLTAGISLILVFLQWGYRLVITYEISNEKLFFYLFHLLPIRVINMEKIEEVFLWSDRRKFFFGIVNLFLTEQWCNKLVARWVVIKKRGLLFKYLVMTPNNPQQFIRSINLERQKAAGGKNGLSGQG